MNWTSSKLTPFVLAALAVIHIPAWSQSPEELSKIQEAMPAKATAAPRQPRKVLVFSQALGYRHASIPYGKKAFEIMGEKTGAFTAEVTDDPAVFAPENLTKYDAIIFNNTTGDIITTPTVQQALLDFVKVGKGVVGIHAATDTNYGWAPFGDLMGGYFDQHPWTSKDTVTLKIDDPEHPVAKAFKGQPFQVTDEIYQFKEPYSRAHNRVLTSLDTAKTDMNKKGVKRTDGDFAVSWVRSVGKGRVFYCSLGHNPHIYWDSTVLQHYLDGIQYALGDLDAPADPRPMAPAADAASTPTQAAAPKAEKAVITPPDVVAQIDSGVPATIEEALAQLKDYDFGKQRAFLTTIDKSIRETEGKADERKKISDGLVAVATNADSPYAARELALRRLEIVGGDADAEKIAALLTDKDERLAEMARISISSIPGKAADAALVKALETVTGANREGLIVSLGKRRVNEAVAPLTNIARSDDTKAAGAAMLALGDIASPEAANALLNDIRPADAVREAWFKGMVDAAATLAPENAELAGKLFDRVLEMGKESPSRLAAFKGKAMLDPKPEAVALEALSQDDPMLRQVARELLVRGKDSAITPQLLALLESAKPEQKVIIAEILGARGDKAALAPLTALAEKEAGNGALQVAAIRALESLGDQQVVPLLLKVAAEQKGEAKAAAESVLTEMPVPEVDTELVRQVTAAPTPEEQVTAIEIAAARKSPGALKAMLEAANKNNPKVSTAAFKAATDLGTDTDLDALLQALDKAQGERVLREAGRAVTAVGQKIKNRGDAAKLVIAGFSAGSSDDVKVALLGVLGNLGTGPALDTIRQNLSNANEKLQDAAIRALATFPESSALDDLLKIASESKSEVYRVLAVRGVARLLTEPSSKPAAERIELLKKSLELAKAADDKKAVIGAAADMKVPGVLPVILPFLDQPEFQKESAAAIIKQAPVAVQFNAGQTAELLNPLGKKLEKDQWDKLEEALTPSDKNGGVIRAWQASQVVKESGSKPGDIIKKEYPQEAGKGDFPAALWAGQDEGDDKQGQLNLGSLYGNPKNAVIFLRAHVWSPEDRKARLDTGSDDCIKAWVNSSQAVEVAKPRGFLWWQDKSPVELKRGWNTVLLKVVNGSNDWSSAARIVDESGKPFADLKFSAEPQQN